MRVNNANVFKVQQLLQQLENSGEITKVRISHDTWGQGSLDSYKQGQIYINMDDGVPMVVELDSPKIEYLNLEL